MPTSSPSLIVLARRTEWERLRTESSARALMLADSDVDSASSVVWIPLDEFARGTPTFDEKWEERLRPCAAGRGAPMVVVWCQDENTPDGLFAFTLDSFGKLLIASLQQDRTPPRLKAIIHISPSGLPQRDANVLSWFAQSGGGGEDQSDTGGPGLLGAKRDAIHPIDTAWSSGLQELKGPLRRPVYLMSERTRVDRQGRSWSVSEIWPLQVARLLAAIEHRPSREGGLRGWRAIDASASEMLTSDIERETFRHVRRCLESAGSGKTSNDLLKQERPDTALIETADCPNHCRDLNGSGLLHPHLPDWWRLDENQSFRASTERLDDSGGLNTPHQSLWSRCFRARGGRFIRDRMRKAQASLEQVLGQGGLRLRIWQLIHRDAAVLPWIAEGHFQASLQVKDDLSRDMSRWELLVDADEAASISRRKSTIKAVELDLARDHFMGVGWRLLSAVAGCLFISTVFASMMGEQGFWIAALAATLGGSIACFVIGWLEVRAGRRALDEVERDVRTGEAAIADGFYRRVALGADGELRGRVLHWAAACGHVRQCAQRLLALCELSERRILKSSSDGLVTSDSLGSFHAATSLSRRGNHSTTPREVPSAHPDLALVLQRSEADFEQWWTTTLDLLDPARSGCVSSRRFTAMLDRRLAVLLEDVRPTVLSMLQEQDTLSRPSQMLAAALNRQLGSSSDLAMVGAPTLRARGHSLQRVVSYIAPSAELAARGRAAVEEYVGSAQPVSAGVAPVDRWGMLGLFLDEVTLTLVPTGSGSNFRLELLEGGAPQPDMAERLHE